MAHAEQAAPIQITLRDFMMVIFRRKWIILSMVAVTTTVVFSALMMTPIVYTSGAKILIWGAVRGGPQDRTMMVLDSEEFLSSECELITSRPIIESAQQMLDDQTARGESKIKIDTDDLRAAPVPKSRIFTLSYTAPRPDDAQRVCEAISTAYTELHRNLFATPDLSVFFKNEIQNTEDKMVDLLNRRLEVKTGSDIADVETEITKLSQLLVTYRVDLVEVERRIAALRSELDTAKRIVRDGSGEVPFNVASGQAQGSALIALSHDLSSRLVERERLMTTYTERHPLVQSVDGQIAEIRKALTREVEQVTALKTGELNALEAERDVLLGKIAQVDDRMKVLPEAERSIAEIKTNLDNLERHSANLYYMRTQAIAGQTSMADYHVLLLSPAGVGMPSNPRDMVRMSLGPVLSLLVGIGLAFFFDNLDHSLKNPEEVERYLGLPVLTSVKRRHTRELAI